MPNPQPIPEIQPTPRLVAALGDALIAASMPPHEPQHGGGGGEPPDDGDDADPFLIDEDEVRQLAHDLAGGRDALLVLASLLRDDDRLPPDPRTRHGLAVLLEAPLARLDLALESLVVLGEGLRVQGMRALA